jgi:hypothetical protein
MNLGFEIRNDMKTKTHVVRVFLVCLLAFGGQSKAQDHSAEDLARRAIERRAVEAVIWGMPEVNAELMLQAAVQAKAGFNQVVYWSRPVSWKNQTLTPNPDTIYLMPFYNTKDVGQMRTLRSRAALMMRGRPRWRMLVRQEWTRARAASI